MLSLYCLSLIALSILPPIHGLDNGVARTPPMGWMSWQRFRCQTDCKHYPKDCISQELAIRTADKLVSDGWLKAGYEYLTIDDCWMDRKRDPKTQELRADPTRFPMGYPKLSDYIHNKGLKVGIYLDYGTHTCAGFPGSLEHMKLDADTMAKWKADYIKLDGCYSKPSGQAKGYAEFGRLLNATGRPMVFSCSYPAYHPWTRNTSVIDWAELAKNCNLWRMLGDIEDAWGSIKYIINSYDKFNRLFAQYAGPGHWNDPDMLIGGNFGLSKVQEGTQMGMWCMFAAPLLLSVDLDTIDDYSKQLLQNTHLIAIDQDPAGHEATLIKKVGKLQYWMRPLGVDKSEYAIACITFNEGGGPVRVDLKLADFGIKTKSRVHLLDVFTNKVYELDSDQSILTRRITPHGILMFRVTPDKS